MFRFFIPILNLLDRQYFKESDQWVATIRKVLSLQGASVSNPELGDEIRVKEALYGNSLLASTIALETLDIESEIGAIAEPESLLKGDFPPFLTWLSGERMVAVLDRTKDYCTIYEGGMGVRKHPVESISQSVKKRVWMLLSKENQQGIEIFHKVVAVYHSYGFHDAVKVLRFWYNDCNQEDIGRWKNMLQMKYPSISERGEVSEHEAWKEMSTWRESNQNKLYFPMVVFRSKIIPQEHNHFLIRFLKEHINPNWEMENHSNLREIS